MPVRDSAGIGGTQVAAQLLADLTTLGRIFQRCSRGKVLDLQMVSFFVRDELLATLVGELEHESLLQILQVLQSIADRDTTEARFTDSTGTVEVRKRGAS